MRIKLYSNADIIIQRLSQNHINVKATRGWEFYFQYLNKLIKLPASAIKYMLSGQNKTAAFCNERQLVLANTNMKISCKLRVLNNPTEILQVKCFEFNDDCKAQNFVVCDVHTAQLATVVARTLISKTLL